MAEAMNHPAPPPEAAPSAEPAILGPAVLFVSAAHGRALAKAPTLPADALVYDLEDAVAPDAKGAAREALRDAVRARRPAMPFAVRINPPGTPHFTEDLLAARTLAPHAIVVPKVEGPGDLGVVHDALAETDAPETLKLWAMIETPRGVLDIAAVAGFGGRLEALIAGTNDLIAMTGVSVAGGRAPLRPWLSQIVLAARANGLVALDGVRNDWRDTAALEAEAREGAMLGFDGKTLIHPDQIAPTRAGFAPDPSELERARAVVAAFERVGEGVGIVTIGGRMVERLHLAAARRLLARNGEQP